MPKRQNYCINSVITSNHKCALLSCHAVQQRLTKLCSTRCVMRMCVMAVQMQVWKCRIKVVMLQWSLAAQVASIKNILKNSMQLFLPQITAPRETSPAFIAAAKGTSHVTVKTDPTEIAAPTGSRNSCKPSSRSPIQKTRKRPPAEIKQRNEDRQLSKRLKIRI